MSGKSNNIRQFWQELKRRRVIHVITVYASAAFVIIELVNNLVEPLNLPATLPTIVIIVLAIGFPLAIILSWIYDLTSEGVERTKPLHEIDEGEKRVIPNAWKIATYVSFIVIIGLAVMNIMGKGDRIRPGDIQSLIVLPFENYTGDDQLEYFVSGMHSSLIGDIGRISGLRVISKTSSNVYKGVDMSVPQIASELEVDAVVESTVTCVGDSICLQVRVISAFPEEKQIWIADYKEEKSQIMNLYNLITKQISDEVQIELTSAEERLLAESKIINPDAYELYLKGKFQMGFLTRQSQESALEYFTKSIETDPEYAPAYAGIAGVWGVLKQMDYVSPDEATPKMEEYMAKALQLDNQDEEVYYYDGIKKVWTDFDWDGGEESFKRCIEINPNFSEARAYYSHLMMLLKRPGDMREQINLALDNDPKNPLIQVLQTVELMIESKYDLCIERSNELQVIMPNNPLVMLVLFQCYTETGKHDLAINELKKIFYQIANETVLKTLDEEYKINGFRSALNVAADVWVEHPGFASAQHAIMLYAYGGNRDKAMYWLEKAYIRKDPANPYIGVVPYLRPYHDEPRYIEIMQRMNLPLGEFQ